MGIGGADIGMLSMPVAADPCRRGDPCGKSAYPAYGAIWKCSLLNDPCRKMTLVDSQQIPA
jgi:hypothetical protein